MMFTEKPMWKKMAQKATPMYSPMRKKQKITKQSSPKVCTLFFSPTAYVTRPADFILDISSVDVCVV